MIEGTFTLIAIRGYRKLKGLPRAGTTLPKIDVSVSEYAHRQESRGAFFDREKCLFSCGEVRSILGHYCLGLSCSHAYNNAML